MKREQIKSEARNKKSEAGKMTPQGHCIKHRITMCKIELLCAT